jgi:proliferating cell nuclear antigen PCNA
MDQCRVSVFELFLSSKYFDEYNSDYNLVQTVESESFIKCCHLIQSDDTLIITDEQNDKLTINLESEKRKISLKLNLMIVTDEYLDCKQSLNYTHLVKIDSKIFSQYYTDIKSFDCENIILYNNGLKEAINFKSSNNTTVIDIECNKLSDNIQILRANNELEQDYPIRYFSLIHKLTPIYKKLSINLGNNLPIRLQCNLQDDSWIRLIIAPKIHDE